jgi:hypothetical protein
MSALSKELLMYAACGAMIACSDGAGVSPRPQVEIAIAPINYPGIADVCYGLTVSNGEPGLLGTDTVWSEAQLCSSDFGNGGGGDLTYVGPCDASVTADNTVALVLNSIRATNGLLDDQVTATDGDPDFQNPCPAAAPCTLAFACEENADVLVEFNLTIMRDADQGFFDIAVNFDDIFCSAKLDCQYADGPIELLHRPDGARGQTGVLAFACTTGTGETLDTVLHMNPVEITCGSQTITLDPTAGPGNAYRLATPDPNLADAVWQYATYRGLEQLDCGGTPCNKLYWNMAFGFDPDASDCRIAASATASTSQQMTDALTPAASTYPWIAFETRLTALNGGLVCDRHPLNQPGSGVTTRYTDVATQKTFCHRYDGVNVATASACCDPLECSATACGPMPDGCGTTVTCRPSEAPPRALAKSVNVPLRVDGTGAFKAVVSAAHFDGGSYDLQTPTDELTFKADKGAGRFDTLSFGCNDVGSQTIDFYAYDSQGTPSAKTQTTLIIQDPLDLCNEPINPPSSDVVVVCESRVTVNLLPGINSGPAVSVVPATAFDAGSTDLDTPAGLTVTLRRSGSTAPPTPSLSMGCDDVGFHPLEVRYADGQGNVATCETIVVVEDNHDLCGGGTPTTSPSAPRIVAMSRLTVALNRCDPTCAIDCPNGPWVDIAASAFDRATFDAETPAAQLVFGLTGWSGSGASLRFGCNDLGSQNLELRVSDGDGLTARVNATVIVQDNTGACE